MRTLITKGLFVLAIFLGLIPVANAIGPVVSLTVTPSVTSVTAGSSVQLSVAGQDAEGVTADLTPNSTFTVTDPKGTVLGNMYSAVSTGTWTVTAKYGTLSATTEVKVNSGVVDEVVLNPNSEPEHITNGKTRTFVVDAYDAFNNPLSGVAIDWTVEGSIGTIVSTGKNSAKFTPTQNGSGRIIAKVGGIKGFVDVVVANPVTDQNTNVANNTNTATTNTNQANTNTAPVNTNIAPTNINTDSNANKTAEADKSCTPWPRSAWIWFFAGFAVLLFGLLAGIRRRNPSWWWLAPFVLTIGALWIYFQFRCDPVLPGLPYLILLAAIIGSSWYTWQRDMTPKP